MPAAKSAAPSAAKPAAPEVKQQAQSGEKATTTPDDTDNFSKISSIILRHEGGYKNDPEDPGDPTNKGISWLTWTKYAKADLGVEPTLDNLKNITTQQAEIIYKKRYWDPSGFNSIEDPKLALMSYDWTITSGGVGKNSGTLK